MVILGQQNKDMIKPRQLDFGQSIFARQGCTQSLYLAGGLWAPPAPADHVVAGNDARRSGNDLRDRGELELVE